MANAYYDESIFGNGFVLRNYSRVHASNEADRYLARRLGKTLTDEHGMCPGDDSSSARLDVVNLNPRVPCAGVNLYTMNAYNKTILRYLPYYPIDVTRATPSHVLVPVYVGEPREDADAIVYDVSETLDGFASAVMIKYFSVVSPINVTPSLYTLISRHFEDSLRRFRFEGKANSAQPGLVQLANGELIYEDEPVRYDDLELNFSGPAITV